MKTDSGSSDSELFNLLQRVRAGQTAYKALAKELLPSNCRRNVLQSNCLNGLRLLVARHGGGDLADQLPRLLPESAPSVVHWFEQLCADILKQSLRPLLDHRWREQGKDAWLTRFQKIQDGHHAMECLAKKLREGLLQRADKLNNLLPNYLSPSDLVQTVILRLLDWLVVKFDGQTDAVLWDAALTALRNKAIEWAQRPDYRRVAHPAYVDEPLDPGPSPSDVVVQAEQAEQAKQAQRLLRSQIDTIPEANRLLFLLHTLEGWTYSTLAALLGGEETEASIGGRVRAVAGSLRDKMGPDQKP